MPALSHIPESLRFPSPRALQLALSPRECAPRSIQYCAPFRVSGHTFQLKWEDRGAALLGNSGPDDEVTQQVATALQAFCPRNDDLTLPMASAPGADLSLAITRYLRNGKLLVVRLPHRGSEYKVEKTVTGRLALVDYSRGRFPLWQAFWDALRGLFSTEIRTACEQQKALEAAIRKNLAEEEKKADEGAAADEPALRRLGLVKAIAEGTNAQRVADSPVVVEDKPLEPVQDTPEPQVHAQVHDEPLETRDEVAPHLMDDESMRADKTDRKDEVKLPAELAMLDVQVVDCEPDVTVGCDLESAPDASGTPSPHEHRTTAGGPEAAASAPFEVSWHAVAVGT
ncbi:hypothetical protein [Cupriavidus sp. AU9028]|uniref:hypothetical protein n=1 Tax=Cupriavidus sp. AU9028 TaxID=2871157 RepID=UPI001C93B16C|nr:hypothetical protein [Cupriavidus sp. AU9028]MBY4895744.1 hypothetical protein [Cupriavidus sp. AU9028]